MDKTLAELRSDLARLQWQADMMRADAEAELRRAKFRFVRTMRATRERHPFIAQLAWWYWRHWLRRARDGSKV